MCVQALARYQNIILSVESFQFEGITSVGLKPHSLNTVDGGGGGCWWVYSKQIRANKFHVKVGPSRDSVHIGVNVEVENICAVTWMWCRYEMGNVTVTHIRRKVVRVHDKKENGFDMRPVHMLFS